jgi:uncharacterized Zn-binding protein involved in type VI secretion
MVASIIVNKVTIVHKGSDGIATGIPPDVCKTPTSGGPVPIPYPNIARSSDLVNGSRTVRVDGQPAALKDSEFAVSTGDEAGTAGGIVSGVNQGKAKFTNYSMDVKIEGRNVARLGDPMMMNGNAPNTSGIESQPNQSAMANELVAKAELCFIFCMCDKGMSGKGIYVPKTVPAGGPWMA